MSGESQSAAFSPSNPVLCSYVPRLFCLRGETEPAEGGA